MTRPHNIIFLLFLILPFVYTCKSNKQKISKPENFIQKEKMAEILADIHIAEASLLYIHKNKDSFAQYTVDYYHYISEIYDIDEKIFLDNMNYYLSNLEELNEIYALVNEILSTKQGEKW